MWVLLPHRSRSGLSSGRKRSFSARLTAMQDERHERQRQIIVMMIGDLAAKDRFLRDTVNKLDPNGISARIDRVLEKISKIEVAQTDCPHCGGRKAQPDSSRPIVRTTELTRGVDYSVGPASSCWTTSDLGTELL